MTYLLGLAAAALGGIMLRLMGRKKLGRGLPAFGLWMAFFLPVALLMSRGLPWWAAIGLWLVVGPVGFLGYYYQGGDAMSRYDEASIEERRRLWTIWREPSLTFVAWLELFTGCVSFGLVSALFLIFADARLLLLVSVPFGLCIALLGLADLLPKRQSRASGLMRIAAITCGLVALAALVTLVMLALAAPDE